MNPFSILMFCFSGAILLYARLLAVTRDVKMIPRTQAAQVKKPREYAAAFAKIMAIVALAPLGSAIYALFSPMLGVVMLIVNFVLCIVIGTRIFKP